LLIWVVRIDRLKELTVKLVQFGDFRIAAWAKPIGDLWIGNFRIHHLGTNPTGAASVPQEGQCEQVFASKEDAMHAAYVEGVESLVPMLRSFEQPALSHFY
jgi:hypothetical protein